MYKKLINLQRIVDRGIIAVIRANSPDQALSMVDAVRKGGIEIIEVTLTVPGALAVINKLNDTFTKNEILLGAGTVLDSETTRAAILAGADFIVNPGFNSDVVRICNRYQIINMAGCVTATEIITALEAGTDIIKFFPGNAFGPATIKALKGPLPQAQFIPTGGVDLANIRQWLESGCIAVGIGGELTKGAKNGDFESVTKAAYSFVQKVKGVEINPH